MGSFKNLVIAGVAAFATIPAASAADFAMPKFLPADDFAGGWYLRGDIGMTNQQVGSLFNVLYAGVTVTNIDKEFESGMLFGLGIGYQYNNWLRFDVTGEYRGKTGFRGLDVYSPEPGSPTGVGSDDYYGNKSEWLVLANAYIDLGTWLGVTPFVGAGVGAVNVKFSAFRDINVPTGGVAFANDHDEWNFAWALHAGLAYRVTPAFTVELAYRYLNMGDGQTGDLITYTGVSTVYNPMVFRDLESHDVKLGVRWNFSEPSMPLARRG